MSDKGASSGGEAKGEIDRSLLRSFVLLRTVVSALCNMGERVLPTMRALCEAPKRERDDQGVKPNNPWKEGCPGQRR